MVCVSVYADSLNDKKTLGKNFSPYKSVTTVMPKTYLAYSKTESSRKNSPQYRNRQSVKLLKIKNNKANDLEKYGDFYRTASRFYKGYIDIILTSQKIDALAQSLWEEDLTFDYAINQKKLLSAKAEIKLKSLNESLRIMVVPAINAKVFREQLQEFKTYIDTLPKTVRESLDVSYKIFNSALTQDLESYKSLQLRSGMNVVN